MTDDRHPTSPLYPALPEILLALGAMGLLMVGAYRERSTRCRQPRRGHAAGRGGVYRRFRCRTATTFGGSFVIDGFARFLKVAGLRRSAVAIVMSLHYQNVEKQRIFEYPILILLSAVGMGMMISAADLIALYLGLELMSLSLYVVAASNRDSVRSTEAGLKYFVLGALSSGMLLYGCSLIYGFTGTVSFAGIAKATQGGAGIGLIFGLVFLFAGLLLQGFGGAVPHVDARRLRGRADAGHRVLRRRAEDRRHRAVRPRRDRRVPRHRAAMAADPGVRRHRLDGARRVRRDRPDATSSG